MARKTKTVHTDRSGITVLDASESPRYFVSRDTREETVAVALAEAARLGGRCVVSTLRQFEAARATMQNWAELANAAAVAS